MIDYLRHLFLPHPTNNFRAKLLHADFFALYVFIFFLLSMSFKTIHRFDPNILGFATDIHVDQLLDLTNQKRLEAGLNALTLNPQLSAAAYAKAQDMFTNGYWAHNSPSGKTPWDFIKEAGYIYTVAGENLAKNFSDSSGVIQAWMNSPTHRDNIMRDQYKDIGFAVVNGVLNGEETTLVVQMFGEPVAQIAQKSVVSASPAPSPVSNEAQKLALTYSPLPLAEISPVEETTTTSSLTAPQEQLTSLQISPLGESVVRSPLLDIGTLTKQLTLTLSTILMIVLVVDAFYASRHKLVRASGKMMAHLLFLILFTGVIWFMTSGSIL